MCIIDKLIVKSRCYSQDGRLGWVSIGYNTESHSLIANIRGDRYIF